MITHRADALHFAAQEAMKRGYPALAAELWRDAAKVALTVEGRRVLEAHAQGAEDVATQATRTA